MAKVKEIVIFLIVIIIGVGIFGFVVSSISSLILPPSHASYDDKVVVDIGGDGILVASLDHCLKLDEKDIPEGYFDTKLITNLSWHDAKNISYIDYNGNKGYLIVWKTSPDWYSVLEGNETAYISDYVEGFNGTCFMEYTPMTDKAYGIIVGCDEISCSEYTLLYKILGLDKSEFPQTYQPVTVNGGYGYGYSGGHGHYGGVDTSPNSIVRTNPDWFYDYYDYGDYDEIDEYLESDGYD